MTIETTRRQKRGGEKVGRRSIHRSSIEKTESPCLGQIISLFYLAHIPCINIVLFATLFVSPFPSLGITQTRDHEAQLGSSPPPLPLRHVCLHFYRHTNPALLTRYLFSTWNFRIRSFFFSIRRVPGTFFCSKISFGLRERAKELLREEFQSVSMKPDYKLIMF